ncbi:hypothetical protein [Halobellus ruber]|uniref:Uncharacterized protein n=1 Tax=Halobellus ruber TaxID=2761102 RepID=A0A7J9SDY0_9EURY|nr:hypothetical protein [Halobellus ruber]MBB6644948.1 hypothetical protein [Halobellus ruber]
MTKTSWSRFSKLAVVCLLALSVASVPAAGVSVGDSTVASDAEVGTQITATVTLTELYQNPQLETWTLEGRTELTDVTWTVEYYDQTGARVAQQSFDGQSFSGAQVSAEEGTSEVRVRITGTVPEVSEYSYDPPQSFTVLALTQAREGGSSNAIDSWSATHYTQESREARNAIDDAAAAVGEVNSQSAEQDLQRAIEAYNGDGDEFGLATDLATQAQEDAKQTRQSNRLTRFALYGVGGVVVIGLVVGGFLYWRSQQGGPDRLG